MIRLLPWTHNTHFAVTNACEQTVIRCLSVPARLCLKIYFAQIAQKQLSAKPQEINNFRKLNALKKTIPLE